MTYEFSGFRLQDGVLQHGGRVVPLMPKAVETLAVLVARAPAVVTKEELMAAVWPDTHVVESSLARNISVIRKALEEHAGPGEYIETLSKRGYRFVADVRMVEETAAAEPVAARGSRSVWPAVAIGAVVCALIAWFAIPRPAPAPPDPATLIGWHLLQKGSPMEATRALRQFEEALASNPNSASAHAGVAQTLLAMARLAVAEKNYVERARKSAETAIRLDPRLDAGHVSLGVVQMFVDWDFAGAERSFERALQLNADSRLAMFYYSQLLNWTRRSEEALRMARLAERADPVSALAGVEVAVVLYSQRRFEEAAAQCRKVLDRERTYTLAHYYLALNYAFLGRFEEAESHLAQADLQAGVLETDRAWIELRKGNRQPAERRYAEIRGMVAHQRLEPSATLLLAAALGRLDEAYQSMESGYRIRAQEVLSLASDPRLEAVRNDARWPAFKQRLKWK